MQINQRLRNSYWINEIKLHIGCEACGKQIASQSELALFHWDHIDPSIKEANISRLVSSGASVERLITELEKCQLLCVSCHLAKHGVSDVERLYH